MPSKYTYPRKKKQMIKYVPKPVKAYVQKQIDKNTENKLRYINLVTQFGSIGTSWNEVSFNTLAQGAAKEQRIGNKIRIKSLEVKGVISAGANELVTDDAFNVIRVIIALYDGATLTPLSTAGRGMNDPLRVDYLSANGRLKKKFLDKYITLEVTGTEQGAGDGYTPQLKQFKYYKNFGKGITVNWSSDASTYPSANLMMACLSDSLAVTNPGFVAGYAVMTYEDA